ncbi:MAG: TetR/AcrR family transcriptional regulator [Solirubrobacteraceae bacterium]|nr:TetR/AcrR family transcriptional regulator [Solirubrobacteraceae bacterium]
MSPELPASGLGAELPHAPGVSTVQADSPASIPQRDRMLMGMANTISKHGYRGATITEVVRFAKVSKRTFYEEFGDKESCFLELYEQTHRVFEQLITEQSRHSTDWREQIRSGARAYFNALAAEPRLTQAYFIEIATLSERATKLRRAAFDHFAQVLVDLVEQGRVNNPDIPSRPLSHTMAVALLGGMTELLIGAIERDDLAESIDALVEVSNDLIGTMVTGQFPE